MRERIIALRKELNLSQASFAEKINISRNFINLYENGNRELSDRTVSDICDAFNINEDWLRTGKGEKLKPKERVEEIAELSAKIFTADPESEVGKFYNFIASLSTEEIELIYQLAKRMVDNKPS